MHLRKAKPANRDSQLVSAAAGAVDVAVPDVKKADAMRQPVLPFQFFRPAVLDDVIDNLIQKNVCRVLSMITVGGFLLKEVHYKKLVLVLSIEHSEAMRKRILDFLLEHAERTPQNLHVRHLSDMLARHALIEALPFLNEKEQLHVVKALIMLYAELRATRPYLDVEEFLLNAEDWKYFLNVIDKVCRADLKICEMFFAKIFPACVPFLSTDNLVAVLPLVQQIILESAHGGEAHLELFRAANKALNYIQTRIPRAALLARGIQPLIETAHLPVPARPTLDALLNKALNDKDEDILRRRGDFDVICTMINAVNHRHVIERLWQNMQNKSSSAFVVQYCMLFAKAFEFASLQDREKIKSNLLAFLKAQADAGRISILEHVKKIMRHMLEQERVAFVKAAIAKINIKMLVSTDRCADEKMNVPLGQKRPKLPVLELLREYQIIREAQRRQLDNQLDAVLQRVLSDQETTPVLLKPVTAIVVGYAKRF